MTEFDPRDFDWAPERVDDDVSFDVRDLGGAEACVCPTVDSTSTSTPATPIGQTCVLYPLRFTATTYALRVTTGSLTETLAFPASGALTLNRNYWMAGDDQADIADYGGTGDLVAMLEATLNLNAGGIGYTVTTDANGFITIAVNSGTFQIQWAHVSTTLDAAIFGFLNSADSPDPAASTDTSTRQARGIWAPRRPFSRDSRALSPLVGSIATSVSGLQRGGRLALAAAERDMGWAGVARERALEEFAFSAEPRGTFEYMWLNAIGRGWPFRVYENSSIRTLTSFGLYVTRDLAMPMRRDTKWRVRWDCSLRGRSAPL